MREDQTSPETSKDRHTRASIATWSGLEFFPLDPRAEDVRMDDIAHALSLKVRYTGQCEWLYTVGHHCLEVVRILRTWHATPEVQFIGLMHDAAEAYLPDVAAPLKPHLVGWYEIELRVERAIAERYALPLPRPREIKMADAEAFRRERVVLMRAASERSWWNTLAPTQDHPPLVERHPLEIEREFLRQAAELMALLGRT